MLLKLFLETKKRSVSKAPLKDLTQKLAEMRTAHEKNFLDRQTTKNAVATKKVAKNQVVALMELLQGVKTSHVQVLLARTVEINGLKLQLAIA